MVSCDAELYPPGCRDVPFANDGKRDHLRPRPFTKMGFDFCEMSRSDGGTVTFLQPIYNVQQLERFRVKSHRSGQLSFPQRQSKDLVCRRGPLVLVMLLLPVERTFAKLQRCIDDGCRDGHNPKVRSHSNSKTWAHASPVHAVPWSGRMGAGTGKRLNTSHRSRSCH